MTARTIEEVAQDRDNGTYQLRLVGYRTDTGEVQDYLFQKDNLDYVLYGVASHVILDSLNKFFAGLGNETRKKVGLPEMDVPGVTD